MKTKLFLMAVTMAFSFAVISCTGKSGKTSEPVTDSVSAMSTEMPDSCCKKDSCHKDSTKTACDQKAGCAEKKACCDKK